MDCKRMSVEIFEQTMPSAKHWRISHKTGTDAMNANVCLLVLNSVLNMMFIFSELPSSPSDYAASAAQSVIGQVLEGVQTLPEDARVPALAEAMTAFMEAWMEHILKQKIKFRLVCM